MRINTPRYRNVGSAAFRKLAAAAALLAGLAPQPTSAQYRINPGDTLEISVAGVPDLRQRASVDIDGNISFPLLGTAKVLGLTSSELHAIIKKEISKKVLRQRNREGHEYIIVVDPDEIAVNIAEYRPIYVSGDVQRPGEITFRPGMTVRQAISAAGGVGNPRAGDSVLMIQAAELRGEHDTLSLELAVERARITRLEKELGTAAPAWRKNLPDVLLLPGIEAQISENEGKQLLARQADLQQEKVHLEDAKKRAAERLAVLRAQQEQEQEGVAADSADWKRVRGLFDKGLAPASRLSDSRRALLLSATRALQTGATIMHLESDRAETSRKIERLNEQRNLELLAQLQTANAKAASIGSKLRAVREKLSLIGATRSAPVSKAQIKVYRRQASGGVSLEGDDALELVPGDVIEAVLPATFGAFSTQ